MKLIQRSRSRQILKVNFIKQQKDVAKVKVTIESLKYIIMAAADFPGKCIIYLWLLYSATNRSKSIEKA